MLERDLAMVPVLLAVMHQLLHAALLEYCGEGEVLCGEAARVEDLWDQLRLHNSDVLILDLCLPQDSKLQSA